ncbi:MAG: bifunctional adenosylcobinamide kinase/adenosylcobinamide-phosphate guanylyltransferase [Pseudanabaenaceae cyanobacterium SKYGB_i_bin29]|nr:bifunctional adenosylcobinamide kinase/adenosylcobinamide-phosphate guanylyltransferase [Pseudanabaenaceae cyanobacterium SKYG29]MDW8420906.1 bifunctional adenosylcobinamide kinase/adenosylcobinamide-phosphate guanylyltransferase [Pseudanabaenaceae cyanobacterium SKYGB_i_bin29]
MITLVTGPTRSGKSEWAEKLALSSSLPVIYIATAQNYPDDPEWQDRIARHRYRRPPHWQVLEIPIDLPTVLPSLPSPAFVLIDSLGTWVTNLLSSPQWEQYCQDFLTALQLSPAEIVIVAEEVGWGLVSPYPLGRLFCDRLGVLVREVSKIADRVVLVVAGYALDLSQIGEPLS